MSNSLINKTVQNTLKKLFFALEYAANMHRFQKRKGAAGIPYINHLIEVSNLLVQKLEKPSDELLVAAVLHDVLEDTNAREDEIEKRFGNKVLSIVCEVTDDMRLSSSQRKELQIQTAKGLSFEAHCIKIADKTCNIRDILYTRIKWSRKRKMQYINWAIKVIEQIRDTHPGLVEEFYTIVRKSKELLDISD
ncbi:hypothetical protein ES705_20879 [subsurface metagenome]